MSRQLAKHYLDMEQNFRAAAVAAAAMETEREEAYRALQTARENLGKTITADRVDKSWLVNGTVVTVHRVNDYTVVRTSELEES